MNVWQCRELDLKYLIPFDNSLSQGNLNTDLNIQLPLNLNFENNKWVNGPAPRRSHAYSAVTLFIHIYHTRYI